MITGFECMGLEIVSHGMSVPIDNINDLIVFAGATKELAALEKKLASCKFISKNSFCSVHVNFSVDLRGCLSEQEKANKLSAVGNGGRGCVALLG